MVTTNVKETEEIKVGGYDGIYCALHSGDDEDISFNQRIYVAYMDIHYVMEMYAASDVPKEDALKIAEGIHLQPVADGDTQDIIHAYNWSAYMKARNEDEVEAKWNAAVSVPKSAMKNTHAVGEAFAAAHESPDDDWMGLAMLRLE
ncbi:MAG: DUF4367 domain-containing protein [Lachnospiraceae bacterium]|nr:DUF4367 domain-containing protein [Lachnospiraceae bacterium]